MPTRPEALDTALIYLEILRRIPKNHKTTAQDIHRQLADIGIERDERSIQRYLEKLADRFCDHIDIDASNKPYGYKWKHGSKGLAIPTLGSEESLLLKLAAEHLRYLLPANIMATLAPFFAQADYRLAHGDKHKRGHEWLGKVCTVPTSQPLIPAAIDSAIFREVSQALFDNRWLDIDYQNQNGERKTHRVMPLALAQQGPSLYLVARHEHYDNERHFALHRMQSGKCSTMGFTRPAGFNLDKHLADGRFGFGEGKRITLTFTITKTAGFHLTETPLSADQRILEESASHYRIQATVTDSAMLDWWLAKFGAAISAVEKTSTDQ